MERFQKARAEFEKMLGSRGRIVVRYSGTEPLLRIMAEGENLDQVESIVKALGEKAREDER
jgi:phosphoglucosamine mutase